MFCPRCEINYHQSLEKCVNCNTKLAPGIICMECGTKNRENSRLCNLCGKMLVSRIASEEKKNEEKNVFDFAKSRTCPNGHNNDKRSIFCTTCGEFLSLEGNSAAVAKVSPVRMAFNLISSLF